MFGNKKLICLEITLLVDTPPPPTPPGAYVPPKVHLEEGIKLNDFAKNSTFELIFVPYVVLWMEHIDGGTMATSPTVLL